MKKNEIECYKVCKVVNDELHSAIVYDTDADLKYSIGKVIKPKVGKIFAFKTLKDAVRFKTFMVDRRNKIFKCRGVLSKEQPNRILYTSLCFRGGIEIFWGKRIWRDAGNDYTTCKPGGTIFLDEIRLIKEVKIQ